MVDPSPVPGLSLASSLVSSHVQSVELGRRAFTALFLALLVLESLLQSPITSRSLIVVFFLRVL